MTSKFNYKCKSPGGITMADSRPPLDAQRHEASSYDTLTNEPGPTQLLRGGEETSPSSRIPD